MRLKKPQRYPVPRERIFSSFSGFGDLEGVKRRKKTICASQRFPFKWLRINPCIEQPDTQIEEVPMITSSMGASKIFHESVEFAGRGVEYAMIMCLDMKNRPTAIAVVAQGGRGSAAIDPTVVFQAALLSNAVGFIFAHNHPSDSFDPSREDTAFTERLAKGAQLVGLKMLDSLVLTDDPSRYLSLLDEGLMS